MRKKYTILYTDVHDIDEDIVTICDVGGRWRNGLQCGPFDRYLANDPSASRDFTASRSPIQNDGIIDHTDNHDIGEDTRAISHFGGRYGNDLHSGVFSRILHATQFAGVDYVASRSTLRACIILPTRTCTISMMILVP